MSFFIPLDILFIWACLALIHLVIRYFVTEKIFSLLGSDDERMDRYLRWSIYLSAYSGLLWGSLPWLNLVYLPNLFPYLSIAVVLGISAAAIATLSMIFTSYLVFLLSMMLPLVLALFFTGENNHLVLGLLVIVYVLVIIPTAKLLYERTKESYELSATLRASEAKLEALNNSLVARVNEQTKALKESYRTDQLTGLPNLQKFSEVMQTANESYVVMLDIREFAILNKQYGKLLSDNILIAVAELLSRQLRPGVSLFRGESDRFIMYCESMTLEHVKDYVDQVISFFEVYLIEVEQLELFVTFRAGISDRCEDDESLIHAEYALSMAKRRGENYFVYDISQEDLQAEKDIVEWLSRTKELILSESIRPYFQPIYDIKQKKVIKYECLARGMINGKAIAPYKFLNAAERLDLTKNITRVMIDKSFAFFKDNDYSFSINLTGADLLDPNFINYLGIKLKRYAMDPSRVVFEILENITTYSSGNIVLESLTSIKAFGCKLAIDDFGVENSNFARLLEIDMDFIKIDGLFIKNILVSEKDKKIVMAIVGLAETLGVETIAEFVENEEIFNLLEECGVDYAQGYHIGKPEDCLLV
jgi:EAL domain-containing protein (putative c-di-GMP-specific phosphodiesterase class I)/GGDEF domain-containing protein